MASNEDVKTKHLKLAGVVKGVHADLRRKFRLNSGDFEKIWQDHCRNKDVLSAYANAMHHLATDIWTKHPETRIHWCRNICLEYFHQGGLKKILDKEVRKRQFHTDTTGNDASGSSAISSSLSSSDRGSESNSLPKCSLGSLDGSGNHTSDAVHIIHENSPIQARSQKESLSKSCSGFSNSLPDFVEHEEDEAEKLNKPAGASVESDLIFGLPDGSLDGLSKTTLPHYRPRPYNNINLPFETKIRLLDVGSCYNPFKEFPEFASVGVDISPAVEGVYQCDFLSLETQEPLQIADDSLGAFVNGLTSPIVKLPQESFHVVVFSLLLEYFPSTYQRWLCCQKAHELLLFDGTLLIITPDSHGQHRNAPMIKSWKKAIESIGFKRWKYVKLEHLHCMAFRKIPREDCSEALVSDVTPDMLYIPQDLHDIEDEDSTGDSNYFFGSVPRSQEDNCFIMEAFQELPDSLE